MASKEDMEDWERRMRNFAYAIRPLVLECIENDPEGYAAFLREYETERKEKSRTTGGEEQ